MKNKFNVTEEGFTKFLTWLGRDSDDAGNLYNSLQKRLTMFFAGRGCGAGASELASLVLDRTAEKFSAGDVPQDRDPTRYIFQVAQFILLEHSRAPKPVPIDPEIAGNPPVLSKPDEAGLGCCRRCLAELSPDERTVIREYYLGGKKGESKRIRGELAADLGIAQGALRVRLFRARQKLTACVTKCLQSA